MVLYNPDGCPIFFFQPATEASEKAKMIDNACSIMLKTNSRNYLTRIVISLVREYAVKTTQIDAGDSNWNAGCDSSKLQTAGPDTSTIKMNV